MSGSASYENAAYFIVDGNLNNKLEQLCKSRDCKSITLGTMTVNNGYGTDETNLENNIKCTNNCTNEFSVPTQVNSGDDIYTKTTNLRDALTQSSNFEGTIEWTDTNSSTLNISNTTVVTAAKVMWSYKPVDASTYFSRAGSCAGTHIAGEDIVDNATLNACMAKCDGLNGCVNFVFNSRESEATPDPRCYFHAASTRRAQTQLIQILRLIVKRPFQITQSMRTRTVQLKLNFWILQGRTTMFAPHCVPALRDVMHLYWVQIIDAISIVLTIAVVRHLQMVGLPMLKNHKKC